MLPVIAMCGHRCGLLMTATTAICLGEAWARQLCILERSLDGCRWKRTHTAGRPDGLCAQLGEEDVADVLGHGADDVDEARDDLCAVLLGDLGLERVEVDRLALVVRLEEAAHDLGAAPHRRLGLRLLEAGHGGRGMLCRRVWRADLTATAVGEAGWSRGGERGDEDEARRGGMPGGESGCWAGPEVCWSA